MSVTDKTLVIKHVFKDVKNIKCEDRDRYGAEERHYGFFWRIYSNRTLYRDPAISPLDVIFFGVGCKNYSHEWSMDHDYSLHIIPKSGAPKIFPIKKETFKRDDADWVMLNFMKWADKDKYLDDEGALTVEYHISIKNCHGIPDFQNVDEFSDVILVCGDGEVEMDKRILVENSEYFKNAILNGNFEKGKQPKIRISGVLTDHVYDFHSVYYGHIDDENAALALYFAEKFNIPKVLEKCRKFQNGEPSSDEEEEEDVKDSEAALNSNLNALKIDSDSEDYATAEEGDEAEEDEVLKNFEKWNCLSDELKMHCVERMDFKSRFLLRSTCHAERRLVDSQKFKIHEVNVQNSATSMYLEICVDDKDELHFLDSKSKKYTIETLYPLLAYILKNAVLTFFQSDGFPNMTKEQFAVLNPIQSMNIRRIMFLGGTSAQMMWLFGKCAPNTIATVEISPSDGGRAFLFDPMIRAPSLDDFKKFIINGLSSEDVPFKMVLFFMEKDSEIGTRFNFTATAPGTMQRFAATFRNRIVHLIPNRDIRIATNNPKKHIMLHYERSVNLGPEFILDLFVLSVIPAKVLSEEEYEKYTRYNIVFVE